MVTSLSPSILHCPNQGFIHTDLVAEGEGNPNWAFIEILEDLYSIGQDTFLVTATQILKVEIRC